MQVISRIIDTGKITISKLSRSNTTEFPKGETNTTEVTIVHMIDFFQNPILSEIILTKLAIKENSALSKKILDKLAILREALLKPNRFPTSMIIETPSVLDINIKIKVNEKIKKNFANNIRLLF